MYQELQFLIHNIYIYITKRCYFMKWVNHYKNYNCFFVTNRIVNKLNILEPERSKYIIIENLKFYREYYNIRINGYVIMSNHIHLIISNLNSQPENTKKFIQNLLRTFSRKIIELLYQDNNIFTLKQREYFLTIFKQKASKRSKHRVWDEHSRSIPIWSENMFFEKLNYIHNNPVKAEMAANSEEYKYSSAVNYTKGDHSIIKIDFL